MKRERHILNHAIASIGKALIFQQDNDPELTVNAVKAHVDTKKWKMKLYQSWIGFLRAVLDHFDRKEQKAAKIQRNLGHIK